MSFLAALFKNVKWNPPSEPAKPAPALPIENVAPVKLEMPALAWGSKRDDWSTYLRHVIFTGSKLPTLVPKGIEAFCPNYSKLDTAQRVEFWAQLISIMAKFESSFNPASKYVEPDIRDAKGENVASRGLLQISIESAKSYGNKLENAEQLHDPLVNLRCAVRIMEHNVEKHGQFEGFDSSAKRWRGASAYWAVMRSTKGGKPRKSYEGIKEYMLKLKLKNAGDEPVKAENESPWMDWMRKHIGEKEIPGLEKNNPFIVWLFKFTSYNTNKDETPWCAATVNAALAETGYKGSGSAAAKSFEKVGTDCLLKHGAIVVIQHRSTGGKHVAFFDRYDADDADVFYLLGGNQRNSLGSHPFYFSKEKVVAIKWPVKKA
jgi:uncharacterized protein (TIGR02594 family)